MRMGHLLRPQRSLRKQAERRGAWGKEILYQDLQLFEAVLLSLSPILGTFNFQFSFYRNPDDRCFEIQNSSTGLLLYEQLLNLLFSVQIIK